MTNQESRWLSIREAALALGVSELTVRRRIKDGRMPHRLTNGKYFVRLSSNGRAGDRATGLRGGAADEYSVGQSDEEPSRESAGDGAASLHPFRGPAGDGATGLHGEATDDYSVDQVASRGGQAGATGPHPFRGSAGDGTTGLRGGAGDEYSIDQSDEDPSRESAGDGTAGLPDLVRLAEVAGRAGILEEQLRALERRHEDLQQGALSLANRNGWLESKLEDREASIKLLSDHERGRPWWKRLFYSRGDRA